MAGNTAIISIEQFRADWGSHVPIAELCRRYEITKDQVLRLKVLWKLPPRLNRALRAKPKWSPPPSPQEVEASDRLLDAGRLDFAPGVARRVAELRNADGGPVIRGTLVRRDDGVVPFSVPVVSDVRASPGSRAAAESDE